MKIVVPAGMLGTGFPEESLQNGLEEDPDFIGVDAGSTDSGPYYLGSGTPARSVERDLELLVRGADRKDIPLLVGSAGTAGADPNLEAVHSTLTDILERHDIDATVAKIHAEQSKEYVRDKLRDRNIAPLDSHIPEMSDELIEDATHIVGVMGADPFITAIENGADIVLAGRSCDSAIFASIPIMEGYPPGLAWHLGKTLECGNACVSERPHQDCMIGYLHDDHFVVKPLNPNQRCTVSSVASHALYENVDPYRFQVPSGEYDTRGCEYEQLDERSVKVSGSRFRPADNPTVKLEGAEQIGYQAYHFGAMRDPQLIENIDAFVERAKRDVREKIEVSTDGEIRPSDYRITFFLYGKNGAMGEIEPRDDVGHEIGFAIKVLAETQETATFVAKKARFDIMHKGIPAWEGSVTNIASPLSPAIIEHGPSYRFSISHLVNVDDSSEPFRIRYEEV